MFFVFAAALMCECGGLSTTAARRRLSRQCAANRQAGRLHSDASLQCQKQTQHWHERIYIAFSPSSSTTPDPLPLNFKTTDSATPRTAPVARDQRKHAAARGAQPQSHAAAGGRRSGVDRAPRQAGSSRGGGAGRRRRRGAAAAAGVQQQRHRRHLRARRRRGAAAKAAAAVQPKEAAWASRSSFRQASSSILDRSSGRRRQARRGRRQQACFPGLYRSRCSCGRARAPRPPLIAKVRSR